MLELLLDPQFWVALFTLATLEIVLGVDNLVFVSIAVSRLAPEQRPLARKIGLGLACITRIALLLVLSFLAGLDDEKLGLFELADQVISLRDLILIGGGLFLIAKATHEIHQKLEGATEVVSASASGATSFASVIGQIMVLDIVFSLDSIITAVGMVDERWVMVTAILISIVFMLAFARPISEFVERHPTVKVLALSFLIMIGLVLIADGFGQHIPKGYVYGAMAFSVFVELINLWIRKRSQTRDPVKLHERYAAEVKEEALPPSRLSHTE